MESLNLNNLVNSLPTSSLVNAEKDVADKFRAAALSITTLYKSSRRTSKRAYNAGYAAACQDMLLMIQQGVSAGESNDPNGGGMTIGRVMDYIEARLEAIKSREEEEDEDEEKERERERERERNCASGQVKAPSGTPSTSKPAAPPLRSREYVSSAPMTPLTPTSLVSTSTHARPASTPPSPPSLYRPLQPPQSLLRSSKSRLFAVSNANPKDSIVSPAAAPFSATLLPSTGDPSVAIINPPTELAFPSMTPPVAPEATGTKRRHAAMTAESTGPSNPAQSVSVPRRRIRSSRAGTLNTARENYDQNQLQASSDAMEVEEDGRERKRVARR